MTQHYKNSTTIYKGKVGSHGTRGKVHNVLGSQPCSITYKTIIQTIHMTTQQTTTKYYTTNNIQTTTNNNIRH